MPARLVYAPKAYAYTQQESGAILNLTEYIVSGNVERKINQVSNATLTLRNPYRQFTKPSQGVAFHPMDPITIYLERIQGYPVRVFTGYLDTTPYYQLYPGTITLQASCTLKRLLYTFFDPSLPYVYAFFQKWGWVNNGQGSIINFKGVGTSVAQNNNTLMDSSISKLLWATLYDIGQWQDSKIYIEALPPDIVARVAALNTNIQDSEKTAVNEFTTFLHNVIGAGSQGSGGGTGAPGSITSGGITSTKGLTVKGAPMTTAQANTANLLLGVGVQSKAPTEALEAVIVAAIYENGCSQSGCDWNPKFGGPLQAQQIYFGKYGAGTSDAVAHAEAEEFFNGGQGFQGGGAIHQVDSGNKDPFLVAVLVEAPTGSGGGLSYTDNQYYQLEGGQTAVVRTRAEATKIVAAYAQGTGSKNTGSNSNSNKTTTPQGSHKGGGTKHYSTRISPNVSSKASVTANTASRTQSVTFNTNTQTSSSNKSSNKTNANGVINPIPGFSNFSFDFGIDCGAPVGSAILAPAACTLNNYIPSFYNSQPLIGFEFDQQLPNNPPCNQWYVSEQINPVTTAHGTHYNQGDTVATFAASGSDIEIGWADNTDPSGRLGQAKLGAGTDHSGQAGNDPQNVYGRSFYNYFSIGSGSPQKAGPGPTGGGGGGGGQGGNFGGGADAFVAELELPGLEDMVTAVALGQAHMGLMHDQSLMPFIQQMCQGSMRSFQSLPNGDFYAFYPDYFGEFDHHDPYWLIDDIEILDGNISLSDDALATHVFAVGDVTWPADNQFLNMLQAGTVNISNAFASNSVLQTNAKTGKGKNSNQSINQQDVNSSNTNPIMSVPEATAFIKRYGARPLVQQYPMVRSSVFEMFLAYQQFMLAWSNQFKTPFTFTFMPELFPGGKVGFPTHGLKMYINSVTHSWDYESGGFQTTAEMTAPSLYGPSNPDLPPDMVNALIEPVKNPTNAQGSKTGKGAAPPPSPANVDSVVGGQVDTGIAAILQGVDKIFGI